MSYSICLAATGGSLRQYTNHFQPKEIVEVSYSKGHGELSFQTKSCKVFQDELVIKVTKGLKAGSGTDQI